MGIRRETKQRAKNLFSNEDVFFEEEPKGKKAHRAEDLLNSIVTVNEVNFNADEKSMDRIDRIIDVANFKYNYAIHSGVAQATAYTETYINTTVPWKTADNEFVEVSVETLALVQEQALNIMSQLWAQYG